jgi:hypothetical protein
MDPDKEAIAGAAGPVERMTCDQNSGVPGSEGSGRDFSFEPFRSWAICCAHGSPTRDTVDGSGRARWQRARANPFAKLSALDRNVVADAFNDAIRDASGANCAAGGNSWSLGEKRRIPESTAPNPGWNGAGVTASQTDRRTTRTDSYIIQLG